MKKLMIALSFLTLSITAQAGKLEPTQDLNVNASLVTSAQSHRSGDAPLAVNLVTVFRGSAMGFSSVFVTFAESLEDASYSFAFDYTIGEPKNIKFSSQGNDKYQFEMTVTKAKYDPDTTNYSYKEEVIKLSVSKKGDGYEVESI